jgi:hypothetical protein
MVIADDTARTRFAGRLELLGIHKHDSESRDRFFKKRWQEGKFRIPGVQFEEVAKVMALRPCRPHWVVDYLAFSSEYKDGITIASVKVDDETGSVEWEVHPRPAG